MVIRGTNNLNLQRNIVAQQVARKCCPYYWALHRAVPKDVFLSAFIIKTSQSTIFNFLKTELYCARPYLIYICVLKVGVTVIV